MSNTFLNEYIGSCPIRQDITVLSADGINHPQIGFIMHERNRSQIVIGEIRGIKTWRFNLRYERLREFTRKGNWMKIIKQ